MKSRDIELKCPKPNVYVLSRVGGEADVPLLMWNSKTIRVYCDSVKNKGDVMAINSAARSFKLGIEIARISDKIKLAHLTVAGVTMVPAEPKVTLERDLVAVAAPGAPQAREGA